MFVLVAQFCLGFYLLFQGGSWLIAGASGIGKRLRLSDMVLGLTLIAFGTSAPELVVSIVGNYSGEPEIVFGNIIGSNIANTFLILGLTGLIYPIRIKTGLISKKTLFNLFSTILVFFLVIFPRVTPLRLERLDGLLLLLTFFLFLYLLFFKFSESSQDNDLLSKHPYSLSKDIVFFSLGCGLLPIGGYWVIDSAVSLATQLNLSEALISVLGVAFGTSLPELVTSIIAARKKQSDLVIGNIIGSNIFNLLLILGATSLLRPLIYDSIFNHDFFYLCLSIVVLAIGVCVMRLAILSRFKSFLFFILYLGYVVLVLFRG